MRFVQIAPGVVECTRCGRRLNTPSPPDKCWCSCDHIPAQPCVGVCPGTELTAIFTSLGATPVAGCDCESLARDMDRWGVDGCQDHHEEILTRLAKNYQAFTLTDKMKAAILAWPAGVATKIKWSDPLPGLLDLAISRSKLAA